MMITIRGFPQSIKFQDIKNLMRIQCNVTDFIVDNLVNDEINIGCKKVRIGLAQDSDGQQVMQCLNGYRVSGNVLHVEPIRKTMPQNQSVAPSQPIQPRNEYPHEYRSNYQNPPGSNYMANQGPNFDPSYSTQGGNYRDHTQVQMEENRTSQWTNNQWGQNQMSRPQNNYDYQQPVSSGFEQQYPQSNQRSVGAPYLQGVRTHQEQDYGFRRKPNAVETNKGSLPVAARQHVLKNVELVDIPPNRPVQGGRYQPHPEPIATMKENFQRPSMYDTASNQPHGFNAGPESSQPWPSQEPHALVTSREHPIDPRKDAQRPMTVVEYKGFEKPGALRFSPHRSIDRPMSPNRRRISPSGRRVSPSGRRISPSERYISPSSRRILPIGRDISPSGRRISPSGRRILPVGRDISPSGRRISPRGRRISPSGRLISPSGRRISPSARRISPSGRRISPSGRRISPSGRCISPSGRRISPCGRRISPSGRRISPNGRLISPSGRRISPSGRRISPSRQIVGNKAILQRDGSPRGRRVSSPSRRFSPTRRLVSPSDRTIEKRGPPRDSSPKRSRSPRDRNVPALGPRFSPPPKRLAEKPVDKNIDTLKLSKHVKPPYDALTQAPNQAMYSGGFRANIQENASYTLDSRQTERDVLWQKNERNIYASMKKHDRDVHGLPEQNAYIEERSQRKSRSPIRRNRSPIARDLHRKHSPSSKSPRRSWAFEKRRSPEVAEPPPPPIWPGRNARESDHIENNKVKEIPKHAPIWMKNSITKVEDVKMNTEGRDTYVGSSKIFRGDLDRHGDISRAERFCEKRDLKRTSFDDRGDGYDSEPKRPPSRRDHDYVYNLEREDKRPDEIRPKRSSQRDGGFRSDFHNLDRDIENVYKRAQEFKKKAEELSKIERRTISAERGHRIDRSLEEADYRDRRANSPRGRFEDPDSWLHGDFPRGRREHSRELGMNVSPRRDIKISPEHHVDISPQRFDVPSRRRIDSPRRSRSTSSHRYLDRTHSPILFQKLPYHVKQTRNKAAHDLALKIIMNKKSILVDLSKEAERRVKDELIIAILRKFYDLFCLEDMSFYELISKFEKRCSVKDTDRMFGEVMTSLPSRLRRDKISLRDSPDVIEKRTKSSHASNSFAEPTTSRLKFGDDHLTTQSRPKLSDDKRTKNIRKDVFKETVTPVLKKYNAGQDPRTAGRFSTAQGRTVEKSLKTSVLKKPLPSSPSPKSVERYAKNEVSGLKPLKLNSIAAKAVDAELEDIMIRVWQQLPDDPLDEADAHVVDVFRDRGGDSLRNILGLNLTKRLLNVFNRLYIKFDFLQVPDNREVTRFVVRYNLKDMNRLKNCRRRFRAYVNTIEEFDRICSIKTFQCGPTEVTAKPFYEFNKCPENLITCFNENCTTKDDKLNVKKEDIIPKKETKQKESLRKEYRNEEIPKSTPKITQKAKAEIKNKVDQKSSGMEKKNLKRPAEASKISNKIPAKVQRKAIETKTIVKKIGKIDKNITMYKNKKSERKSINKKNTKHLLEGNDFDELDDDAILALMSKGIVVDEC